jgi:hypothetical protein
MRELLVEFLVAIGKGSFLPLLGKILFECIEKQGLRTMNKGCQLATEPGYLVPRITNEPIIHATVYLIYGKLRPYELDPAIE